MEAVLTMTPPRPPVSLLMCRRATYVALMTPIYDRGRRVSALVGKRRGSSSVSSPGLRRRFSPSRPRSRCRRCCTGCRCLRTCPRFPAEQLQEKLARELRPISTGRRGPEHHTLLQRVCSRHRSQTRSYAAAEDEDRAVTCSDNTAGLNTKRLLFRVSLDSMWLRKDVYL